MRTPLILAAAGALAIGLAAPAMADPYDHHDHADWAHHQARERHESREHHAYYAPPPVVYSPPAYYAPPPPVVYGSPGITLGVTIP